MNGGDFVFQVQYSNGAGRLSHMGDCREHLLLSRWSAFTAGWSQADYLRQLRLYLERLINLQNRLLVFRLEKLPVTGSNSTRVQRCEIQLQVFLAVTLSGVLVETRSATVVPAKVSL